MVSQEAHRHDWPASKRFLDSTTLAPSPAQMTGYFFNPKNWPALIHINPDTSVVFYFSPRESSGAYQCTLKGAVLIRPLPRNAADSSSILDGLQSIRRPQQERYEFHLVDSVMYLVADHALNDFAKEMLPPDGKNPPSIAEDPTVVKGGAYNAYAKVRNEAHFAAKLSADRAKLLDTDTKSSRTWTLRIAVVLVVTAYIVYRIVRRRIQRPTA